MDVTLADFAADMRAPTPSAAAERLVPDQHALKRQLRQAEQRLQRALQTHLERDNQRLDALRARLRHPGERLTHQRQHLQALAQRLARAMQLTLSQQQRQLGQLGRRLASQDMARLHRAESERIERLQRRLASAIQRQLEARQARLHSAARALSAVSPLAVLGRGYAIAQDEQGQIVRRAQDTQPGQLLKLKLGEGCLSVEVKRRYQK